MLTPLKLDRTAAARVSALVLQRPVTWGLLALSFFYMLRYLRYPSRPGNQPNYPAGWWGWWDQSKFIESTAALAHHDFSASQHWYPLGYALLGAPFYRFIPLHPFFFVDLGALLVTFTCFVVVCGRANVSEAVAVLLFLFSVLGDHFLFAQWLIPWNTSPSGALVWLLLALATAHAGGRRRPFPIGFVAAWLPLIRPTDIVFIVPSIVALLALDFTRLRAARARLLDSGLAMAAGFAIPVFFFGLLYLRIYGPHPTEYMIISKQIGFSLHDFLWKAYVIFVNPVPWFTDGEGLLRRCPWLALGIAGLAPGLFGFLARGRGNGGLVTALLAATVLIHAALYLSYVDMLPTGLWRFNNIHYWSWILPGYALLGWKLLGDLFAGNARARSVAGGSILLTGLLLCVQINPVVTSDAGLAKMVDFPGIVAGFSQAYSSPLMLADRAGVLQNIDDMRVLPVNGGVRAVALRRAFQGPVTWVPGAAPRATGAAAPIYWRMQFKLGRPCWLPLMDCEAPTENPAMPGFPDS